MSATPTDLYVLVKHMWCLISQARLLLSPIHHPKNDVTTFLCVNDPTLKLVNNRILTGSRSCNELN